MTANGPKRLAGRTVLVTGATGFIGSRIVLAAAAEGATVRALSRSGSSGRLPEGASANIVRGNLNQPRSLEQALSGCTDIVNTAFDFLSPANKQVAAFENLLEAAKSCGARSLIQVSSIAVYDDWPNGSLTEESPVCGPGSDYKIAKCVMERSLANSGIPYTILQPTIVYGAGGWQWTDRPIEEPKSGVVILPDDPRGICHAVHVDDVAEAAICALALERQENRAYIISGPAAVEWIDLYSGYASLVGSSPPILESMGKGPVSPVQSSGSHPFVLTAKKVARNAFGETGMAAMRQMLSKLRNGSRTQFFRPTGHMLELYRSRGACSIKRAQAELYYAPKIDLVEGLNRVRGAYRS